MREFGRRSLLGGLAGAGGLAGLGGLALVAGCAGPDGAVEAKAEAKQPANGRRLSGRLVVSIPAEVPALAARDALAKAYRRHRPEVEIVWDTAPVGVPDIVVGDRPSALRYISFDDYRYRTNPYTSRSWDRDYQFGATPGAPVGTVLGTESSRPLFFYNKEIFDRAELEPPVTWDELVAVCEKVTALNITPISTDVEDILSAWFPSMYFDQFHVDWADRVRAREGDWDFDPRLDARFRLELDAADLHNTYTFSQQRFYAALRDHKIRFDTGQIEAIVESYVRVFPKHAGADFFERTDQYTPFLLQQTAMMVSVPEAFALLRRDLAEIGAARAQQLNVEPTAVKNFDWDVFECPSMTGPLVMSDVRKFERPGGIRLGAVRKNNEQAELAMDFLMFWLSRPGFSTVLDASVKAGEFTPAGPPLVRDVRYPDESQADLEKVGVHHVRPPAYGTFWLDGGGHAGNTLRRHFERALRAEIPPATYGKQLQAYFDRHFGVLLNGAGLTAADIESPARRPATTT